MKLVVRSGLMTMLLACLLLSLGLTVGCGGGADNSIPEVTKDELAAFEQQLKDAQSKRSAKDED